MINVSSTIISNFDVYFIKIHIYKRDKHMVMDILWDGIDNILTDIDFKRSSVVITKMNE